MKVRLIGLYEDVRLGLYEDVRYPPDTPKRHVSEPELVATEPIRTVQARLANVGEYHGELAVPGEMVRGAEIGDEFTLHLERVKK